MTAKRTELIQFPEAAAQVEKAALRAVRGREDYRRYVRDYFSWIREKSLAPADPLTLRRYIRELGKRYSGGSYAPILAAIKNGLRGAARALLSAVEAAAVAEALRTVKAQEGHERNPAGRYHFPGGRTGGPGCHDSPGCCAVPVLAENGGPHIGGLGDPAGGR